MAANKVERADRTIDGWLRVAEENDDDPEFSLDDDEEYQDDKVELEIRTLEYKRALQRLSRAQPELGLVPEEDCDGREASEPLCPLCSCGSGARAAGENFPPWLAQLADRGFCIARPGECDWEGWSRRCDVMNGYAW